MSENCKMEKRIRGSNFLFEEKSLLLSLVTKHFDVIENKRTDSTTSRCKDLAWQKVADEFNKDLERGSERSVKQLRVCYENIKRKMKRSDISPFAYYNHEVAKEQRPTGKRPILPKHEEPENMLVMVNPDMVPPDPYDSSDMNTASNDGPCTPEHNSADCPPYTTTPIISIQRTGNPLRNSLPLSTPETSIRIVTVDTCVPSSSSAPNRPLQREAEPSSVPATPALHPRLSGITLSSGDITVAPVAPKTRPSQPAPSTSSSQEDGDPECLRLKRRLLRQEVKRVKMARRMEVQLHQQQLQLLEAELRHKDAICEMKKQMLEAKRNYYLSFKSPPVSEVQQEGEGGMEQQEQQGEEEEQPCSPDNPPSDPEVRDYESQ